MNWQQIIETIGSTTAIVAALAWVSKAIISAYISRDLEKYKSDLEHSGSMAIASFKSNIELESQKRIIEFSSLHKKRAELIASLYSQLFDLYQSIQMLWYELGKRESDESETTQSAQKFQLREDMRALSDAERDKLNTLLGKTNDFYRFYGYNKIYFNPSICEVIDKFYSLAKYLALNYEGLTIKDNEDEFYLTQDIRDIWERASVSIPLLLKVLEDEFRELLGVESKISP